MPIYEYRCASCGAELEKLQKISDPPLVECPECGKDALVKLVSASSFRLKGSGWYETDFKTGKKKNGAGDADSAGGNAAPESAKAASNETKTGAAEAAAGADAKAGSKSETSSDTSKSADKAGASSKPAAKE